MTRERTVAFVDLAGFTALIDVHGDDAAVELTDALTDAVVEACRSSGSELVKTVGDAAMIAAPTPAAGSDAVHRLFREAYQLDGSPNHAPRLHRGPLSKRDSDYFGATLN